MVVTLVSDPGSVVKNFQIVTNGGSYNDVACVFKQGVWYKGKLSGANCTLTNYFNATVRIRQGDFLNDLENGNITAYEFPKTSWDEFVTNPAAGIDSTKLLQVYSSGTLTSTISTINNKKIKGSLTLNSNGYVVGFTFSEV